MRPITLFILLFFVFQAYAQNKPLPEKFDNYMETKSPDFRKLEKKARLFAKRLSKAPDSTKGLIFYYSYAHAGMTLCSKEKRVAEERYDFVKNILFNSEKINPSRIISVDGLLRNYTELEFWIVPKEAEIPEATATHHEDCFCAQISVSGAENSLESNEILTFSASVSGGIGRTVKYDWTISSGTIISGQGTPVIEIRLGEEMPPKITATVVTKGANSSCCEFSFCIETASFTTNIVPTLP